MSTQDPFTDIGVALITEIFTGVWRNVSGAPEWIQKKFQAGDPFKLEAEKYAQFIDRKYNSMRILGMSEPVPLDDIFIDVNVLENNRSRRKRMDKGSNKFSAGSYAAEHKIKRISGKRLIERKDACVVLGGPGAGKTTFLKNLALQAIRGEIRDNPLPIYIPLKEWSDSSLTLRDYITEQFSICHLGNPREFVEGFLQSGRCMLLLDGYDEVGSKFKYAIKEINNITDTYHKNKFVLTCRLSGNMHTFDKFTEVCVADFDDHQIQQFINKWFQSHPRQRSKCLEEINEAKNARIKELAKTPLLLTLTERVNLFWTLNLKLMYFVFYTVERRKIHSIARTLC